MSWRAKIPNNPNYQTCCLPEFQSINRQLDDPCCLPSLHQSTNQSIINLTILDASASCNQSINHQSSTWRSLLPPPVAINQSIINDQPGVLSCHPQWQSINQSSINHRWSTWRSLLPPPVPPPRLFPITVTVFQSSDILPEDFQRLCNQLELSCLRAITFSIEINH